MRFATVASGQTIGNAAIEGASEL